MKVWTTTIPPVVSVVKTWIPQAPNGGQTDRTTQWRTFLVAFAAFFLGSAGTWGCDFPTSMTLRTANLLGGK